MRKILKALIPNRTQILKKIVSVRSINPLITAFFFLAFLSCNKESIQLPWDEIDTGISSELTAIHFTDQNTGHAVGGDSWSKGVYLQTKDGGDTWTENSIADKQLFGLDFNSNGRGYTVGIDGYLFDTKAPYEEWKFLRMPRYDFLRGVAFNDQNQGVLVGGVAFNKGALMVVDTLYYVTHIDTFNHQLNAVCYSDDLTVHIAGYGLLMRSPDGGNSWIDSEIIGDNYRAICFPSSNIGYVVGYNGTILKTEDAGQNWKRLRNGDAIRVSDQPFTDVYFADVDRGYISGDGGLCWRTSDGGENWEVINGLPNIDFNSVFAITDKIFLVGEDGRMVSIQE